MDEFMEKLCTVVKKRLGSGYDVTHRTSEKYNAGTLNGVCIAEEGRLSAPLIYADAYYGLYKEGGITVAEAADCILDIYRKEGHNPEIERTASQINRKYIENNVLIELIGREGNEELLEKLVHREWLDLAIVYYVIAGSDAEKTASLRITHDIVKNYGLDISEEFYRKALYNTLERFPPVIKGISEIISESTGHEETEGTEKDGAPGFGGGVMEACGYDSGRPFMEVLTNEGRMKGAAAILYPGVLRETAERYGTGILILPSSVYETILVPDDGSHDTGSLKGLVREVNDAHLDEWERLSYSVYRYDRGSDSVCTAGNEGEAVRICPAACEDEVRGRSS